MASLLTRRAGGTTTARPFEPEEAAPGIQRFGSVVNWYLVEEDGRYTVVDAGLPADLTALKRALDARGASLDDVAALVLTHGHFDHIGFAHHARRAGVLVYAHELETRLLEHPMTGMRPERNPVPYLRFGAMRSSYAVFARTGALHPPRIAPDRTFVDGARLDVPGKPVVVFTPGHTHGHCALHFEDRDTVISADSLVTWDPYTGAIGPRVPARAATEDSRLALRSLETLARTRARVVLPGHGHPWRDGVQQAVELAAEAGVA